MTKENHALATRIINQISNLENLRQNLELENNSKDLIRLTFSNTQQLYIDINNNSINIKYKESIIDITFKFIDEELTSLELQLKQL